MVLSHGIIQVLSHGIIQVLSHGIIQLSLVYSVILHNAGSMLF